ncbi:hypothetical protein AG1IA_06803 [Rhizoctonia solani AG-1 IA]|uniref:Uncharacterized protein n=1 Tax=Thanatephorus cucumeris (strain AG1-IA) TaxID=983506 RepID=L8WRZ6_THACA|nr:hypothetical protein AG1IA_06803 [Rhizoctonia solani AG-1 IA]
MGKTTNIPIPPVRHNSTTPQDPPDDSIHAPEASPRSPSLTGVDQTLSPLPRASLIRCGLASAPPSIAPAGPSLVSRIARESLNSSANLPIQTPPGPLLQSPEKPFSQDTEQRYSLDPHRPNHSSSDIGQREPTPAPAGVSIHPIIESHEERLDNNVDLPRVKIILSRTPCALCPLVSNVCAIRFFGGGSDFLFTSFIDVKGVRHRDIHVHCVFETIDKEFDWFFDPNGIAPGGLLILCRDYGIEVTDSFGQTLVDTIKLHTSINKLQVPCTLEVVIGACKSEGLIAGLDRLLAMDTKDPGNVTSSSESSTLFKALHNRPLHWMVPKLNTKIVWAAAADDGIAYGRRTKIGSQDLMIEYVKIIRSTLAHSQFIQWQDLVVISLARSSLKNPGERYVRNAIFKRKLAERPNSKPISKFNRSRDEKFRSMASERKMKVQDQHKPQLLCLLASSGNHQLVLDTPFFVAVTQCGGAIPE